MGDSNVVAVVVILLVLGTVVGRAIYQARPIFLALLIDAWDMILPKSKRPALDHAMDTLDAFDAFVANQAAVNNVPGMAVAIVARGDAGTVDVVWSKGYGLAHISKQVPATPDTPFGLGSISKTFIAFALMQAIEDGHLTLDTDINDVLPFQVSNPRMEGVQAEGARAAGGKITLRHLVTHTSGIKDHILTYNVRSYSQGDPAVPLGDFLREYLTPGGKWYSKRGNFLAAQPGDEYEYSNIASGLTAYVIERAVGQPFEVYTKERIFDPLKMKNTGWFIADFPQEATIAMPYNRMNRPYDYLGIATWPDGQLRASANDLGCYLATVMNGGVHGQTQLLTPESVHQMLVPPLPSLEVDDNEVDDEEQYIFWGKERGMIGHNGGDPGVFTLMFYDPEKGLGAVVLTNSLKRKSIGAATNILRQILRGDGTARMFGSSSSSGSEVRRTVQK